MPGFQETTFALFPPLLVALAHLLCWFLLSPLPFKVSVPGTQSFVLFYFPSMLIFLVISSDSMALNNIYRLIISKMISAVLELQPHISNCLLGTLIWMSHSHLKQNTCKADSQSDPQGLLPSQPSFSHSVMIPSFQSLRQKTLTHPLLFFCSYHVYNQPVRKSSCFYLQIYTESDHHSPTPLPPPDLRAPPPLAWIMAVAPCVSLGPLRSRHFETGLQEISWGNACEE